MKRVFECWFTVAICVQYISMMQRCTHGEIFSMQHMPQGAELLRIGDKKKYNRKDFPEALRARARELDLARRAVQQF